jgi:hypothetical protein
MLQMYLGAVRNAFFACSRPRLSALMGVLKCNGTGQGYDYNCTYGILSRGLFLLSDLGLLGNEGLAVAGPEDFISLN